MKTGLLWASLMLCLSFAAQAQRPPVDALGNLGNLRLGSISNLANVRTPLTQSNLYYLSIIVVGRDTSNYTCKTNTKGYLTDIWELNPTNRADTISNIKMVYTQDSILRHYQEAYKLRFGIEGFKEYDYDMQGRLTYSRTLDTVGGLLESRTITWARSGNHTLVLNQRSSQAIGTNDYVTLTLDRYLDGQSRVVRDSALLFDQALNSSSWLKSVYQYDNLGDLNSIANYQRSSVTGPWSDTDSLNFRYQNDTVFVTNYALGSVDDINLKVFPSSILRAYQNRTIALTRIKEILDNISEFNNNFYEAKTIGVTQGPSGSLTDYYWTVNTGTNSRDRLVVNNRILSRRLNSPRVDSVVGLFTIHYDFFPIIVSLPNGQQAQLQVYPNPAHDQLMIKDGQAITLYGSQGQLVSQLDIPISGQVNIVHLPAGVYQGHIISTSGQRYSVRLVKD